MWSRPREGIVSGEQPPRGSVGDCWRTGSAALMGPSLRQRGYRHRQAEGFHCPNRVVPREPDSSGRARSRPEARVLRSWVQSSRIHRQPRPRSRQDGSPTPTPMHFHAYRAVPRDLRGKFPRQRFPADPCLPDCGIRCSLPAPSRQNFPSCNGFSCPPEPRTPIPLRSAIDTVCWFRRITTRHKPLRLPTTR